MRMKRNIRIENVRNKIKGENFLYMGGVFVRAVILPSSGVLQRWRYF